jgi:DNA polymerase
MVLTDIHIDFETRSAADLRKTGLYVYAEHPSTDVWCACWCIDDGPIMDWRLGDPPPQMLFDAIAQGALVFCHNSNFEWAIWHHICTPRHGWPVLPFSQTRCTAAMAAAMALPRALKDAAVALGSSEQKDMAGSRLMMQLAKPRRINTDGSIQWWDVEEKIQRLIAYCRQDVETERALTKKLRPLPPTEYALWQLDHLINTRGVRVDLQSVRQADVIVKRSIDGLNAELERRTAGAVEKIGQVAKLTEWLRAKGVDVDSLDKQAIKAALKVVTDPNLRRVLEIRQEAAKSSTAKLDAFKQRTSADGRMRENFMYHGASTGRWSGKGAQLQNFPRASMKQKAIEQAIECFAKPSHFATFCDMHDIQPLTAVADTLKGMVVASPGHEIVHADFSNIEGRVLAWLAGQEDKLEAFRAFDRKEGPDLYKVAASGMLGIPVSSIEDDGPNRQIGKVSELALGYQGGHGAFISMAKNYNVTPADITPAIKAVFADRFDIVADGYDEKNRYNLPCDEWTALRIVVDAWRAAHPAIVQFWADLDEAAMRATIDPGRAYPAGPVSYASKGNILWCRLPSGRLLAYVDPKVRDVETPWGRRREAVTYMAVNSLTRRWERTKGYGGLWSENITQAAARDVMGEAMLRIEARGWPVILTVHDDIASEVPEGTVSVADYAAEMVILPAWARGLPVAAAGAVGRRYGK